VGALCSYLALSLLVFGRAVIGHPLTVYVGRGPDPQLYIWFLAWWAHAISHGFNPLLTNVIWAPSGVNLAWTANMPLASCALYPTTLAFGPIASYNFLCLTSTAVAGWSAFALCRYVVRDFWPAWLGGWLFAFSPYMLSRMLANVDLTLVWPIPLAVLVTVRQLDGVSSARAFVAALALLVVVQFLLFAEIVASATLLGATALAMAAAAAQPAERRRFAMLVPLVVAAYAISAVLLLPWLRYMFTFGAPRGEIFSPWHFAIDLASFFVPTSVNETRASPAFWRGCARFPRGAFGDGRLPGTSTARDHRVVRA
jgi:hypothetical protein